MYILVSMDIENDLLVDFFGEYVGVYKIVKKCRVLV